MRSAPWRLRLMGVFPGISILDHKMPGWRASALQRLRPLWNLETSLWSLVELLAARRRRALM